MGTPIYAVDRVNGKMYGTFEGGYKLSNERAMLQPQYSLTTSLGSESINTQPLYMNITTWNNQYRYTCDRDPPPYL